MNEKFVAILEALDNPISESEELDEGRPRKEIDPDAPVKEKGKRGRPKKDKDLYDDEADNKTEGKRDLTLTATIKGGKGKNTQEATESKTLKDAKAAYIDKMVRDFENVLTVKYANKWDFDEDEIKVSVADNFGWTGVKASDMMKDPSGNDSEDEGYEFGRKEK